MNQFTCLESLDVFRGDGHEALAGFGGGPGDVGGEGEVFGLEEGVGGEDGFGGDDVAGGAGDAVRVQGIGESGFVDEWAAGGVDEEGGGFHPGDGFLGYQTLGFGRQGAVERDDIRFFEDFIDRGPSEREGGGGGAGTGVGEDVHFESGSEFRRALANASETDDSQGLAGEFGEMGVFPETEVLAVLPFAGEGHLAVLGRFFEEIEYQGKNELRDGVGAVDGDIRDGDAVLLGVSGVDDVVAGGEDGNEFQSGQLSQSVCTQRALVGEDDVGVFGTLDDLVNWGAWVNGEFTEFFNFSPRVVAGVESVAIEDYNVHGLEIMVDIKSGFPIDDC